MLGDDSPHGPIDSGHHFTLSKREGFDKHSTESIVFAVLIPVLVLLSGLFAGLTLGYMSLDETQLNVLSISGTPEQRKYANKIMPIRKNGHLLLVTLLLCNMIVNESLPVIADPVLGGGVQGVVVSTVLIVIFAEIIPQSLFTRHGLYLGAKMAGFTKVLIYIMGVVAWPVAKLLEFVLGPHHGIIYRRGELKELIALHSSHGIHGGDLKNDTVTIIGATLDLQEKVVKQAMTPIKDVFMLSIDSKLDYDLLKKICQTGHSRVPVYEEVDVPIRAVTGVDDDSVISEKDKPRTQRVKKIIGIFLVKQCVLLDPKDATPLRKLPLNKVPFVPNNEPLLGILDKFQEGRSHMAIVSRFSVEKAASVKKAVKRGLTQRLRERVGMGDTDSDTESSDEEKTFTSSDRQKRGGRKKLMDSLKQKDTDDSSTHEGDTVEGESGVNAFETHYDIERLADVEKGQGVRFSQEAKEGADGGDKKKDQGKKGKLGAFPTFPGVTNGLTYMSMLEQSMPADAVLAKEGADEFLQGFDPAVMPLGIITLEDVLEELIGEEIYDEFDTQGAHGDPYEVPPIQVQDQEGVIVATTAPQSRSASVSRPPSAGHGKAMAPPLIHMPTALKGLGFFRTRSAPPMPQGADADHPISETGHGEMKRLPVDQEKNTAEPSESGGAPTIQMPKPIRSTGRQLPAVILEQHSSVSSSDSGGAGLLLPSDPPKDEHISAPSLAVDTRSKSLPTGGAASTISEVNPPLEAALLDRKRRLVAAARTTPTGSSVPSPAPVTPGHAAGSTTRDFAHALPIVASPSPSTPGAASSGPPAIPRTGSAAAAKGTRFKSTPLGGGERAGAIVAEQVGAAYSPSPDQAGGEETK